MDESTNALKIAGGIIAVLMTLVTTLLLQRRADSPNGTQARLSDRLHDDLVGRLDRGFKDLRDTMNGNHRISEKAGRLRHRRVIQQIVKSEDELSRLYRDCLKHNRGEEKSA